MAATGASRSESGGGGPVRVAVAGYRGKVGREMERAVQAAQDLEYAGGVEAGEDLQSFLTQARPQAVIDFTHPSAAPANALAYAEAGICPVIGTTGFTKEAVDQVERACQRRGVGGIIAPNFAVGAVLMMWLAEKAAPFFDAAEVIELHHATKADAPSGTALATARRLNAASHRLASGPTEKFTLEGVRGGQEGSVTVHSVRLPGLVADQQVLLGLPGQILSISHRTTSREAFVPGVLLAVRRVTAEPTFYRSLDALLGLD